jgi:hypothetical protein
LFAHLTGEDVMENNEDDLKVFNKLLPDYDLG